MTIRSPLTPVSYNTIIVSWITVIDSSMSCFESLTAPFVSTWSVLGTTRVFWLISWKSQATQALLSDLESSSPRPITNCAPQESAQARTLPVDSDSRFPLIEHVRLVVEPPLVLSDQQSATLREFLSVAKSYAQLEAEGVDSAVSLLMYGPPGCGKSRLARHVASELGLNLYIARLDGLISSYLGSTSKNIRALFDFAANRPCVLFLDEFDAIAKLRGDTQELGELKRVVNSFIQNLDTIGKQSIILAATNHESLLDAAIWRRFTYRLELSHHRRRCELRCGWHS